MEERRKKERKKEGHFSGTGIGFYLGDVLRELFCFVDIVESTTYSL